MAKSSINLEKANQSAFKHNDRTSSPDCLIGSSKYNECDISASSARTRLKYLLEDATVSFKYSTGQKLQAKSYLWEAVVNCNIEHGLLELQRLAEAIEKETGFIAIQTAVHRDEGHIDVNGAQVFNFHAHIIFFTLELETGVQLYRRDVTTSCQRSLVNEVNRNYPELNIVQKKKILSKIKKERYSGQLMNRARLSKLQDITATIMNMERGAKGSQDIHMAPKQYKRYIKVEEANIKLIKENEELLEKVNGMKKSAEEEYAQQSGMTQKR